MFKVNVTMLDVGESFVSDGSGITLKVAEKFKDGRGTVFATQDGKSFKRGVWHTGDESDEGVWVEVWDVAGRQFHGVVDSVSRKVTQTG